MAKEFVFSFYVKQPIPILVRRPWWNLFGRDKICYQDGWVRKTFANLSQSEADILVSASHGSWNAPISRLLLRLMGETPSMIQIEEDVFQFGGSEYVSVGKYSECGGNDGR